MLTIPTKAREEYAANIFYVDTLPFLTILDRFSKFLVHEELKDTNSSTILTSLKSIFAKIRQPRKLVMETDFDNANIRDYCLHNRITMRFTIPNNHNGISELNAAHSTLSEIIRILRFEKFANNINEIMLKAVATYNSSIHSSHEQKPEDVFYIKGDTSDIKQKLISYKNKTNNRANINRVDKPKLNGKQYVLNKPDRKYRDKRKPERYKLRHVDENYKIDNTHDKIHPRFIKPYWKFTKEPTTDVQPQRVRRNFHYSIPEVIRKEAVRTLKNLRGRKEFLRAEEFRNWVNELVAGIPDLQNAIKYFNNNYKSFII